MHSTGTTLRTSSRRHDNDRGFTLVEILISIVLVGILSAVVVVGIGSLTSNGSNAACLASADAAKAATTIHLTNTGATATTIKEMVDLGELSLPAGVTLDSTGLIASGNGWTMTMKPGTSPTFGCSGGTSGSGAAGSAAAMPPVTAGLVSRLDASSTASMFQDSAGSTPATTAGQRVCRWADNSGTNTHALQPTSAQCPKYGTDATGGYLDFDANGQFTVTPTLTPDFSVFVVAQSDTPTWNTYGWLLSGRGANGMILHAAINGRSVGGYVIAGGTTYHYLGSVTPANIMVPHLYELSAAGNSPAGRYGVDGSTSPYTISGSGRTAAAVPIKLGSDDMPGRYGNGKYREVLIFNRALTTTELAQVEAYLIAKWKLS